MYDKELVRAILNQIAEAADRLVARTRQVKSASFFTNSPEGMEKLDGVCMLFIAIGESLKNLDKITGGTLLAKYPEVDWTGAKGFRDIIAHHYFDVDAEQVFWICTHQLQPLADSIRRMLRDLE
jgi:uncharacterized protein with HEPN domain